MPGWLTPASVYAAWAGETVAGVAGYVLVRGGYRIGGLALIALYAVLGLGGFMHYSLAPLQSHTLAMNATIWVEAAAAVLLLATVALQLRSEKA